MTRSEKIKLLQEKGNSLVQWFEGRKLPASPLSINKWTIILDVPKFVEVQLMRMRKHHENPYSKVYITSYLHLNDFKTFIDGIAKNNLQPEAIEGAAKPGN